MSTLDERYGRRTTRRWVWPTVTAVGVALGIVWAAWVALDTEPVTAEVHGYAVESPARTVATIEVRRPDPVPVRCTVYAQALDHSVVGERTVDVVGERRAEGLGHPSRNGAAGRGVPRDKTIRCPAPFQGRHPGSP